MNTYNQKYQKIISNLEFSSKVNSFDMNGEKEAITLAHALLDMEESFKVISETLLVKLTNGENLSGDTVEDILLDIGEELRHVLYHIKDPQFFRYLIED